MENFPVREIFIYAYIRFSFTVLGLERLFPAPASDAATFQRSSNSLAESDKVLKILGDSYNC